MRIPAFLNSPDIARDAAAGSIFFSSLCFERPMSEPAEIDDITLCLSGGGLRATYFHLGVIWALRQKGLLKKVKRVYAVSGGSIAAAHFALNWSKYVGSSDND